MQLRAIGSSSSVPRPGRACSSYLVRDGASAVVLDLGSGAFGKLRAALDYPSIDAVAVSHMHADHFLDLIPLRYGMTYGPFRRERRLPLFLPPGGETRLRELCRAFDREGKGDFLDGVYDVAEYDPGAALEIGTIRLTFAPARHFIEAYAIRAQTTTASVTYSGDTSPCDSIVECARGSDLFLCEATLGTGTETGERGHCSAAEAGTMARSAGVARLALTHYGGQEDPPALRRAARAEFGGDVTVVDDGLEFEV
ncbi:MAG TPA: MBL fold metallo-hydrolase [Candidatus Tumulicola sp.]|nr:MBL fold metallo-hydrolase [Candidatus Tumulicola sp.]